MIGADTRPDGAHAGGRAGRPHVVASGPRVDAFAAFAASVLDELRPDGVLEALLADRVAVAAWALQPDAGLGDDDEAKAERSLVNSLEALNQLRADRRAAWGQATAPVLTADAVVVADDPTEADDAHAPFVGSDDHEEDDNRLWSIAREMVGLEDDDRDLDHADDQGDVIDPQTLWRGRLTFDRHVSADSPIVVGTWITVRHVVSLVVDNWSWADILRAHPELTEADIRACLTYAVEEEGAGSLD